MAEFYHINGKGVFDICKAKTPDACRCSGIHSQDKNEIQAMADVYNEVKVENDFLVEEYYHSEMVKDFKDFNELKETIKSLDFMGTHTNDKFSYRCIGEDKIKITPIDSYKDKVNEVIIDKDFKICEYEMTIGNRPEDEIAKKFLNKKSKDSKIYINRGDVKFEIVDKVDNSYSVWNITNREQEYIYLYQSEAPNDKNNFKVNVNTLKAIKLPKEEIKLLERASMRYSIDSKDKAMRATKYKNETKRKVAEKVLPIYNKIFE